MKTLLLLLLALGVSSIPVVSQTTATIDVDTTTTTPLHSGFSGVNDEISFPVEYWDYRFNLLASQVGYGWVRFPGGITGDAYNWQTGEEEAGWVSQFANNKVAGALLPGAMLQLQGKGGGRLIDAANRANLLDATLIACVNGFTDTPQSIGQMAAYAKANHIPVAVWELSNEPYNITELFPNGTTYLDKMKPYRDAIKAADPSAVVAIFATDPGAATSANPPWDKALSSYSDKYWDAVTYHYYPQQSTGAFAQWMADENAALATHSDAYVTGYLTSISPPGMQFLISEFNPSMGSGDGTSADSLTNGTLYGGIYDSEFIMRMSTVPSVLHVGPHAIASYSGVLSTNSHAAAVSDAANAGTTVDTVSLNFGFYHAAQANALAVLNGVINHAVESNKTTVTGGAMVPATGIPQIPALYAMSYTNAAGGLSIVVTNKSATPHQVTIRVNGSAAAGTFPLQYVSGTDPSVMNSSTTPNAIAIQTGSSANPVTVPAYSVLRVDVTTPPVATVVHSASYQAGPVAPLELVTAFGAGFASQVLAAQSQPLPTMLGDTTIAITDSTGAVNLAPLAYVSPSQASFLIPVGIATGTGSVKVMRSGTTVLTGTVTIATAAPGLFAANGNGAGVVAAIAERVPATGAPTPLAVYSCQSGVAFGCLSTPMSLGNATDTLYVELYGSGIRGAGTVQAYVAGQLVPVAYAGAQGQFAGVDQVNITIPRSLAGTGEASVYLAADGKLSNMVTVNLQ